MFLDWQTEKRPITHSISPLSLSPHSANVSANKQTDKLATDLQSGGKKGNAKCAVMRSNFVWRGEERNSR